MRFEANACAVRDRSNVGPRQVDRASSVALDKGVGVSFEDVQSGEWDKCE